MNLILRPRRNRVSAAIRGMCCETEISPAHFILPLFDHEGKNNRVAIKSMPGQFRLSRDLIVKECREAAKLGISAVALFPALSEKLKDKVASESLNSNGLLQQTIKAIKDAGITIQ